MPSRTFYLLAASLLASCGPAPVSSIPGGGVDPKPAVPASPPEATPTPAPTAPPSGAIDLGRQRGFSGNVGRVNVMLLAGEAYAERVRKSIPAFAAVLRVTNGEAQLLPLDREKDEVVLRLVDGRQVPRVDIWQRADWLPALAALPAADRSRFRYPDGVLPGAAVEVTVTFDAEIDLVDVKDVWVRLPGLPGGGTVLPPMDASPVAALPRS